MNITIVAVGTKMPAWVEQGYQNFAKRMQQDCKLKLIEVAAVKRDKQASQSPAQINRLLDKEQIAIEKVLPKNAYVVALEVKGKSYSTEQLAGRLSSWMHLGQEIALLVGGPEGLPAALSQRADEQWSLSTLTLPHPIVRVIVAEALYRAWSLNNNHPYHRAD